MSALRERDDNSAKLRAETSLYPGREDAIIEARTARYARESFIVDDELSCKDKFDEETADWERYPIDGLLLQRNEKVSADKVSITRDSYAVLTRWCLSPKVCPDRRKSECAAE